MEEFNYSKYCIEQLLQRVPDIHNLDEPIKSYLEEYIGSIEDDTHVAHGIYEDVVCGYYVQLIKNPTKENKKIIEKIMHLVEDLAGHKNYYVRNVIEVSFCEPLIPELNPYSDVEKYLLPKALALAKSIAMLRFGIDANQGWKKLEGLPSFHTKNPIENEKNNYEKKGFKQ